MKSKFVIMFFVGALMSSCKMIEAGYEGILVKQYGTNKGVQKDVTLVAGKVFFNPFTEDVIQFPMFVQTIDYEAFTVNAKDGSVFIVDPTISFYVMSGKSPYIYTKYRQDLVQITRTTLLNYVQDAFRIQMNKYTTDELISNRQKFEDDVQKTLDESLQKEGFKLEQMTSGLKYPETIVQAIDLKNKAVQQGMQVENELKVAEAQAKIELIRAEALSKANELRQKSLTPLLIQQQFIEKWDGKTPLYGNSPLMFKNINDGK
jgi:regulator of protease activity HflC (stomatin/prohibitin superfamily)